MISSNCGMYVRMMLGVMAGGGVAVFLDPQATEDVICGCLNKAEADVLIWNPHLALNTDQIRTSCKTLTQTMQMAEGTLPEACGGIISAYEGRQPDNTIDDRSCAAIIFTSGTTGEEKGVMLSHANLIDTTFNGKFDVNTKLSILPMHHAFSLKADFLTPLGVGSTTCFHNGMDKLVEALKTFEPTCLTMVPMIANALYNKVFILSQQTGKTMEACKPQVFGKRINQIVTGGAHLPSELVDKYQKIGIWIAQGYGMTECSPSISIPCWDRPDKAHSSGMLVRGCEVRIVDGEVQVKSPSVMMGYVNAPELTAQIITQDGWLRTGDVGYVDDERFIYITGRIKNLIILSNGENVAPEQIENLLLDHQLVEECLVYGDDHLIAAEIYPNSKYMALNNISDAQEAVAEIIQQVNATLPSYKRIAKHLVRTVPFKKTGSNKIVRSQRASRDMLLNREANSMRMPENETQQMIYDCVAQILGHQDFGIDSDIFAAGMDSMGCIMLLSAFSEDLKFTLELDEFMAIPTVEKLAKRYTEKSHWDEVDHSIRPVYGMSGVQMSFAYVMRGNTTSNIPFLFKLDRSVDLERMKKAIEGLFPIHPILNDVVQMFQDKGYANFRDDSRPVNIPIIDKSLEEWEETMKGLIRPYLYTPGEPLYHIELYRVGDDKYLFFDVAHIISDGMTASILLEDMNRLYQGETLEPEKYTYYDFLIDHEHRMKMGLHIPNIVYYCKLMGDKRITRSILNRPGTQDLSTHINAALHGRFTSVDEAQVQSFCRANNISENVFFMTAFNYLISIYSDSSDTISSSIHNGRIDSRWGRIAGCLFAAYGFRRKFEETESMVDAVRTSGRQILETMRCYLKNPHPDEMFFQYQGKLLEHDSLGGAPAESIPLQLDSLPFHLMVMNSKGGYRYELRFWENRFDGRMLQMFVDAMDAILGAMLKVSHLSQLHEALPKNLYPAADAPQIRDRYGRLQPIGAWGTLMEKGEARTARILLDGTVDYLEASGRSIMVENMFGRNYPNLHKIEEILRGYPGVVGAQAFSCYWQDNTIALCADVATEGELDREGLCAYLNQNLEKGMVPQYLFKNSTIWK
jgi:long-subunit acyl-CoA synthetase (AMP-forming)